MLPGMRPFRFGLGTGRVETADEFFDAVRRAELGITYFAGGSQAGPGFIAVVAEPATG